MKIVQQAQKIILASEVNFEKGVVGIHKSVIASSETLVTKPAYPGYIIFVAKIFLKEKEEKIFIHDWTVSLIVPDHYKSMNDVMNDPAYADYDFFQLVP